MLFIATAIVAVTEFFKRIELRDWRGAAIIALAALIGAVAGHFHVEGLAGAVDGLVIGLGAAGIHTVARQVG